MNDIKCDAEALEAGMSAIMRGLNRLISGDPLSELPLAQLRLLRAVSRGHETPSSLAEYLSTSVSAVTQIANRLATAGLIEREDDPHDRRVRRLRLSMKGSRLVRRRSALRVAAAERMLACLSDEDREAAMRGIELIKSTCDGQRADTGPDSLSLMAELEQSPPVDVEARR